MILVSVILTCITEDSFWMGVFVAILPRVTISTGYSIGTLSVVQKDIPKYRLAGESPNSVINEFNLITALWVKK